MSVRDGFHVAGSYLVLHKGSRCKSNHFVVSFSSALRSKEALWSYERHLKKKGDGPVELFQFSEQEDLNVNVLADKLNGSSSCAQVSVLLMLTGSSSYLWLDREHHPKNVELCTMLKRFPRKLNFVICPTSRATRDEWETQTSQAPGIFGDFWDNNVSVWDGFDRDVASKNQICSLICTEGKGKEETVLSQPWKLKYSLWLALGVLATLVIYQLWNDWKEKKILKDEVKRLAATVKVLEDKQQRSDAAIRRLDKFYHDDSVTWSTWCWKKGNDFVESLRCPPSAYGPAEESVVGVET